MDQGFGKVKCIFNQTHFMNATIVDDNTIKCSTPKLSMEQASLPPAFMHYKVNVTLNGRDFSDSTSKFAYYPEPVIKETNEASVGPFTGNANTILKGVGFAHPNICKLRVRYGALETTPLKVINDTVMETVSPAVNVPDAVALAPSGNAQQYGADITLHYRDVENTFTYH